MVKSYFPWSLEPLYRLRPDSVPFLFHSDFLRRHGDSFTYSFPVSRSDFVTGDRFGLLDSWFLIIKELEL